MALLKEKLVSLNKNSLAIRQYIATNPGLTENQISDAMTKMGICSRMTTLKAIRDLLSRDLIEDRKERENSFHRYYINNKNYFNRLDRKLSEIELIISSMEEPTDRIFNRLINDVAEFNLSPYKTYIESGYYASINLMLETLLLQISNDRLGKGIVSKSDTQELYIKITKLSHRIKMQLRKVEDRNSVKILNRYKFVANGFKKSLMKMPEVQIRKIGIDIRCVNDLISAIQDFKETFLNSR